MYAGCVACCPLVSQVEYAPPRALLTLESKTHRRTDGWTDGRTPDRYITATVRRGQRNKQEFTTYWIKCESTTKRIYSHNTSIKPANVSNQYINISRSNILIIIRVIIKCSVKIGIADAVITLPRLAISVMWRSGVRCPSRSVPRFY